MTIVGIAVAGACGALARYGLSGLVHRWLGSGFPWGTLVINLLGCFLLGLLMELSRQTTWVPAELRTVVAIGFLGAFTTFSTFGFETFRAFETGDWSGAMFNVLANVLGGLLLVAAGATLARLLAHATELFIRTGGGS
jgi:CrcB protein